MSKIEVKIGSNIPIIRKVWGLNQDEFAVMFETTRGSITLYENQKVVPNAVMLARLSVMTGVPAYDLMYRDISRVEVPIVPYKEKVHGSSQLASVSKIQENQILKKKISELTILLEKAQQIINQH